MVNQIIKHHKQLLALIPVNLLSICCGYHLAYGIYNSNIGLKIWMFNYSIPAISMVVISFHIAAFFGGTFGSLAYKYLEIYKLMLISSTLMMTGIVTFFISEDIYTAILSARILIGSGFGISQATSLFYIAEISSPKTRSRFVLFQHFCLTLGMFLHAASDFLHFQFGMGIFMITIVSLTFPIAFYTMKESHVWLMENNKKDSLERLKYFRGNSTDNIEAEYEALKSYLVDEEKRKLQFFGHHNTLALLVIIMLQIGFISVSNGLHNYLRLVFMRSFLMELTDTVGLGARILGVIVSFFILDIVKRKVQFSISGALISVILSAFGALILFQTHLWLPLPFFITIEFLLGLGMSGLSEILKSELFPMKERPFSMSVACFFEEGLQIVTLILLYSWALSLGSNPTYWTFIFSGILLMCSITVWYGLKDSRGGNLVEASRLYSR